MTFWNIVTILGVILPIIVIIEAIIIARIKRNPSYLIFIFPMVYTSVFYTIFLINVHTWRLPDVEFQVWFRSMVVLNLLSLIVYLSSKLWAYRIIQRKRDECIEEKANGRTIK